MVYKINPKSSFGAQSPVIGRNIKRRIYPDDMVIFDLKVNLAAYAAIRAG
jgi:hypothetical protein